MKTTLILLAVAGAAAASPRAGHAQDVAPATIAQGKAIFEGKQAGALCFTCHGMNAKGTPGLAPDLTDAKWLHGDGSMAFLQQLITAGVPKPKEAAAPMPPMGGANLKTDQVQAVAAYVFSLSRKR